MGNITDTAKSSTLRSQDSDVKEPLPSTSSKETPLIKSTVTRAAPLPPSAQDGDSSGLGYADSNRSDSGRSDKSGSSKKRRAYDKIYRTNEPIPGAPDVDFPEKLWDLSEEDLLSLTSPSETESGQGSTLTRPAKDIEYISRPRQTGRHALASESGYSSKDGSEDPYSPKYTGQYSPIASYSPTYSDIYSPPLSPTSGNSPRNTFNNPGLPEPPKSAPIDKIKTFTLPPKKGKSVETLIDPPTSELPTFSSKSTMV